MFERFTREARTTVEAAVSLATRESAGEVRPEHLLAAALVDEGSGAVQALVETGVRAEVVRTELDRRRHRYVDGLDADDAEALAVLGIDLDEVVRRLDWDLGGPGRRPGRRPRFARTSKKALELALREAIDLGHGHIGTEHLLLGLVRGGDRVVLDTLAATGVERRRLRAAVAETQRRAG